LIEVARAHGGVAARFRGHVAEQRNPASRSSPMSFESLRRYCATLPGATRDVKWGADEVYSVGGRMFAVFRVERGKAKSASFKCEPGRFLELTDQPGIVPAPYLARAHWVQLEDATALPDAAVRELVRRSRALVFARLPRKMQAFIADGSQSTLRRT
jgi:predicted DNA-binding protein (MmcQ/YjbR family)